MHAHYVISVSIFHQNTWLHTTSQHNLPSLAPLTDVLMIKPCLSWNKDTVVLLYSFILQNPL